MGLILNFEQEELRWHESVIQMQPLFRWFAQSIQNYVHDDDINKAFGPTLLESKYEKIDIHEVAFKQKHLTID